MTKLSSPVIYRSSGSAIGSRRGGRLRILVIEDEARILSFLARGLEAEGYSVEGAADGHAGLALALEPSWDLVVLDLLLPGLERPRRAAASCTESDRRCRCSSSRPARISRRSCTASSSAPPTTCRSRSRSTSCSRACASSCETATRRRRAATRPRRAPDARPRAAPGAHRTGRSATCPTASSVSSTTCSCTRAR